MPSPDFDIPVQISTTVPDEALRPAGLDELRRQIEERLTTPAWAYEYDSVRMTAGIDRALPGRDEVWTSLDTAQGEVLDRIGRDLYGMSRRVGYDLVFGGQRGPSVGRVETDDEYRERLMTPRDRPRPGYIDAEEYERWLNPTADIPYQAAKSPAPVPVAAPRLPAKTAWARLMDDEG